MASNNTKSPDEYELGKKLIKSAIILDETLADLLKFEIRKLKKAMNTDIPMDELEKTNILLRNIIYLMTMTDEKIRHGIELCKKQNSDST